MAKSPKKPAETRTERGNNRRRLLVDSVAKLIKTNGLSAVKARDVSELAGVALGWIYHGGDLDDLVLEANALTLIALEKDLAKATSHDPAARLVVMANAYLTFAQKNTLSWKALFEHKLPEGKPLPEWYLGHQLRLFDLVDQALQRLCPHLSRAEAADLARTIFSAVHGVVALGLEEKLGVVPTRSLSNQLHILVTALVAGLPKEPSKARK